MSDPRIVVLFVLVLVAMIWVALVFNQLTKLNNRCQEAWADVDTELKRRYDLVPNLVTVVTGYAHHERETFESVTRARNQAIASTKSPTSQAHDENILLGALRQLFAVAERYPTLKADQHFLRLQQELVTTEDRIEAARRFYNANVRDFNTRIQVFPSNIIARLSGFAREDYFEIEDTDIRSVPQVNLF